MPSNPFSYLVPKYKEGDRREEEEKKIDFG